MSQRARFMVAPSGFCIRRLKRVLRGSVVKCRPEDTGLEPQMIPRLFCGGNLWKNTLELQPSTDDTQDKHEYMTCRNNMTEMI